MESADDFELFPHEFALGLLDEQGKPLMQLFVFPVDNDNTQQLHPSAAKSLKIIDIIRLSALFLGVFSFCPKLDSDKFPQGATWVTVHEQVDNKIQEEDVTKKVGETCVSGWVGRALWLRIRGQQPGDIHNELVQKMVERAATIEADKRPDTRTLQKKFEETYNLDPHTCELSGDTLAVQIMHLVPPELGSGVFYELLHAVQTRATSHWTIMGDILRKFPPNEAAPIIGNIALLPKNVNLVDEKAKGSINSAKNLGPGAASLHWVGDKHNGFSLSTTPPIWLDRADTCHSVTAFLKEVKHERLPKVKPMRISSVADRCRFIVRSLSDAAKLYLRFASPSLRSRINEITEKLKVELEAIKKKRKNTEELEGERAKKKKKTAGTKNTQPYDRDGDNDREDRGGRDNADKPKDLSDKSENAPDGNANNGGEGSSGGGFPTSTSGGGMSDSSSGGNLTDSSNLSLTRSDGTTDTNMDDHDDFTPLKSEMDIIHSDLKMPGLDHIFSLLMDLEYEEESDEVEYETLKPASRRTLQRALNVWEPTLDDIERFQHIKGTAEVYFAIILNFNRFV